MLTIVILMIVTLTTLYTARVVVTDDKVFANTYRNNQAMGAARAGYDYALGYLNENISTVTTGLSSCASVSNTYALTSGTLANNATYTMTYGCVTAASTTYLTITAVGTNADGSARKTVAATVKVLSSDVLAPIVSSGATTFTASTAGTATNSLAGAQYAVVGGGTITPATTTAGTATYTPNATLASNATIAALTETNYLGNTVSSFATATPSRYMRLTCTGASPTYSSTTVINSGNCTTCTSSPATLCSSGTTTFNNIASASSTLIYFAMGGNAFLMANSAANTDITLGTSTSPVVLVVQNASSVTVTTVNNNNTNVIWGNIYTDSPLTIQKTANNGTFELNGLVFSSGSTLTVSDNTGAIDVTINGELVGRAVTVSRGAVNLTSTTLGYVTGTYNGYVGTWATTGIPLGGGSGSYGLVAGSLKDF